MVQQNRQVNCQHWTSSSRSREKLYENIFKTIWIAIVCFVYTMNNNRINQDIINLINNKHVVHTNNLHNFHVSFNGPSETPYENGLWIISVTVDEEYPFKPPIVQFKTKIYHPNIDQESGAICMNVLRENWSPIYDMLNIFEQFLPQLLKYPNPYDPLNMYAAKLILHNPTVYEQTVLKHVRRYAYDKSCSRDNNNVAETDEDNPNFLTSLNSNQMVNCTVNEVDWCYLHCYFNSFCSE